MEVAARSGFEGVGVAEAVSFRLLGPVEVVDDGAELDLGTKKQRAVLAVLLLNANRVVTTERLIDQLWGERPPETARSALQVYVAGLRKALGRNAGCLRTSASGYVVDVPAGSLDVQRFSALYDEAVNVEDDRRRVALLREALALWRDRPLADLASEPFAARAASALEEQRLEALELRIDADLRLGRHAALVPELESLVAEHPYREALRGQLMLALYRAGRQFDALRVYQSGRRVLADELGLRPSSALRELEAAILRQDDALALGQAVVETDEPPRSAARSRRLAWLVGLAALGLAALAWVVAGRDDPSAIVVQPGSVAAIDARSKAVVAAIPVGARPGAISAGEDAIWVSNLEDRTLTRLDPATRRITRTIPLAATATGIEVGLGAVWAAHGRTGQLSRIDPAFDRVTETVDLTGRAVYAPTGSVAVGNGSVWVIFGNSRLVRVKPGDLGASESAFTAAGASDVAFDSGSIWVAGGADSSVLRFSPRTFQQGPLRTISVGTAPSSLVARGGVLWAAITGDDVVARIDADSGAVRTIPVGDGPEALAVGADAVWVANRLDGTISRIDPDTADVETISVGNAPAGIAVADGIVWVTVQEP